MNRTRVCAAVLVALLAGAGPSLAQAPPPFPVRAPNKKPADLAVSPKGKMGYYLVQGNRIVSPAYDNDLACQKALVALRQGLRPGTETVFCAHRRP